MLCLHVHGVSQCPELVGVDLLKWQGVESLSTTIREKSSMTTHLIATVVSGVFKPDQPLPLPELTRVRLTVEPVVETAESVKAWEGFKSWIRQNSLHGMGRRLTRDELHERD